MAAKRWARCVLRPCRDRPLTGRIFVCYRWKDAQKATDDLVDRLAKRFGAASVFQDIKGINPGEDYRAAIQRALASCHVVLVVMGHNWLTASNEHGRRSLDSPTDQLRREVEIALESDSRVRVIPVLVEGAHMPRSNELPDSIARLAYRIAHEVRRGHFEEDVQDLIERIRTPRASRFTKWGDIRRKAPVWALIGHALWRPLWSNAFLPAALVAGGLIWNVGWLLPLALFFYLAMVGITLFDLQEARCVGDCLQQVAEARPAPLPENDAAPI